MNIRIDVPLINFNTDGSLTQSSDTIISLKACSVPSVILQAARLTKGLKRKTFTRFTIEDDFLKLTFIISQGNTGLRCHDHLSAPLPVITYETMYKHHVALSSTLAAPAWWLYF
jgi:hypothetical protein